MKGRHLIRPGSGCSRPAWWCRGACSRPPPRWSPHPMACWRAAKVALSSSIAIARATSAVRNRRRTVRMVFGVVLGAAGDRAGRCWTQGRRHSAAAASQGRPRQLARPATEATASRQQMRSAASLGMSSSATMAQRRPTSRSGRSGSRGSGTASSGPAGSPRRAGRRCPAKAVAVARMTGRSPSSPPVGDVPRRGLPRDHPSVDAVFDRFGGSS